MGAKNCPETPRQKMISMMYLVYTAMLALNVSVEILQAFVTVGDSMEITNRLFSQKISSAYQMFENAYKSNPSKVEEQWKKAQVVKEETSKIIEYIDGVKYDLVAVVEKLPDAATAKALLDAGGYDTIKRKDDYSTPTLYFLGGTDDGSAGKGIELRKKIEEYQDKVLSMVDKSISDKITIIDTRRPYRDKGGIELSWQVYNFYHMITLADLVLLNKFKSEIQNMEFDLVNSLYSSVSADDFKFDNVQARVIPVSNYVLRGGKFEADVFVAAYDSKSQLRLEMNGQEYIGDSGLVHISIPAAALGEQKRSGKIFVKKDFEEIAYDFDFSYMVAEPSATISAEKMNVLYIGVDNPVSISVPGVSNSNVIPSIAGAGGTIARTGDGLYNVRVAKRENVTISASVKSQGQVRSMGAKEFRVKRLPQPEAAVGKYTDGNIDQAYLSVQAGLLARMPQDFDFELNYVVSGFTMQATRPGGELTPRMSSNGSRFTPEMKNIMNNARRGQKFFFENITAKGPDGERRLKSLTLTIQ